MSDPKAVGHTPGPWHLSAGANYVRYTQSDGTHPNICSLSVFGGPIDERDANGYLLAAAPDLLAACKEVDDAWAGNGDMATAVDAVLLAIAKAHA